MVSLAGGHYHLSKRKTKESMADFFQADVSLGSVPALEQRTSEAIHEPVQEAREYVKTKPVVHMDETGWREANKRAWLWVAATTWVTVFLIRLSRGSKVAKEMLGEAFQGIVNSDRWSAYNWLRTWLRQLCWAHLLRNLEAFVERGAESQRIGEAILAQAGLMFQWWHKVRDGTMSRAAFQEQMRPVQRQVGELPATTARPPEPVETSSSVRTPYGPSCASRVWNRPTTFGERQVRPGVLWRNGSFGIQSEAGSRFVERITTVVATLRQQQRNVLDYLTEACDAANWDRKAPFDPGQWWPDWPDWPMLHQSPTDAEKWIEDVLAKSDRPRDAYLREQAAFLGIDLPADEAVAVLPTPPRHEHWLELPGTGGWVAYRLCRRPETVLYLWENFSIVCGTLQEMLLAGLIAWELGAPPRAELPIRLDGQDLMTTLRSGETYHAVVGRRDLHGHRDLRILHREHRYPLWL